LTNREISVKTLSRIPLYFLLAAGLLFSGTTGTGQERPGGAIAGPFKQAQQYKTYKDGELLVRFKPARASRAAALHRTLGARDVRRAGFARVVRLPAGMSVEQALAWYRAQPDVEYAEYHYRVRKADTTPNDPSLGLQWWLRNAGQMLNGIGGTVGADIGALPAWDLNQGSNAVIVALVDTGVDYNHPDLAANIWSNPLEASGSTGVDDDNNGYVDDARGWNFADNNNNPMDDDIDGHGTHVAGIIGAVANNNQGVAGINWSVKLMPLKFLDANGDGDLADAAEAIRYAADNGARIINASYSYPQRCGSDTASITERQAIEYARDKGALIVAAAGNFSCNNDLYPSYPSSHVLDNVISVAASNQRDEYASGFSNYGASSVHLFAPGDNIYSTIRSDLRGVVSGIDGYDYIDGTSMAAPMVSGILALLAAHDPALEWKALRETVLRSADKKDALKTRSVTGGRANAFNALSLNLAVSTPLQPSHFKASKVSQTQVDLTWLDDSTIEAQWVVERKSGLTGSFVEIARYDSDNTMNVAYSDMSASALEGTLMTYRVKAANVHGDSDPSAEMTITTPLAAPTSLAAKATSETTVRLTWADNSGRETSYRVERALGAGIFTEIISLAANVQQFDDSGLIKDSEYRYRVRAHHEDVGFSAYSNIVNVKTSTGDSGTKVGCFIATAAYGSALHPRVNALRQFRDAYLLPNVVGRAFVHAYYRASPPLADFIARHDWLRAGVRTLLWPLTWLAEALIPDAQAGAFFRPSDATKADADKLAIELRVERQLLVKVKPAVDADTLLRAQGALSIKEISPRLFLADFADVADRTRAESALNNSPQVEYAEANRVVSRPPTP
jgi:subtilisin family serine protease